MIRAQNTQTESKNTVLNAIRATEQILARVPFRSKFYELTASYVFNFDIHKVINDQSYRHVIKFCRCFFMFLTTKLMLRFVEMQAERTPNSKRGANSIIGDKENKQKCQEQYLLKNRVRTTNDLTLGVQRKGRNIIRTEKDVSECQKMGPESQGDGMKQMSKMLIRTNKHLRQAYFELNECFNNRHRVKKIEIISFLMTLISRDVFIHIIDSVSKVFSVLANWRNEELNGTVSCQNTSNFEQEVYIVLTYQTLGNLVSNNVFKCLKKKYVKQTIFNTDNEEGYYKLIKSLKHIKERLTHQNGILIKGRKQRAEELRELRKKNSINVQDNISSLENMKKFLQETLKTREQIDFSSLNIIKKQLTTSIDPSWKIVQTLYPSGSKNSFQKSIPIKTQLHTKFFKLKAATQKFKRNKQLDFGKISYKIKNVKKKFQNLASARSERNSYKFSLISLDKENSRPWEDQIERNPGQQIKAKLTLFKQEALKDLEAIQKFNPLQFKQNDWARSCSEKEQVRKNWLDRKVNLFSQKEGIDGKQRRTVELRSINQLEIEKESAWRPLYNIRSDASLPNNKKVAPKRLLSRVYKNSDRLRKEKNAFELRN